jgi:hypothetical protein
MLAARFDLAGSAVNVSLDIEIGERRAAGHLAESAVDGCAQTVCA